MKIGIYDPYLDSLGGGERYALTLAKCLSSRNDVCVFWDDNSIRSKIEKKISIDINKVNFSRNIFAKDFPFIKRLLLSRGYDIIIFVSDGSIPFLLSKKVFIVFQYPVNWINTKTIKNRLKFLRISSVICYSEYVKRFLDKKLPIKSVVINPPADVKELKNKKTNLILTVGRFTRAINSKKQEVLIEEFKKMEDKGLKDWELIVVGSYLKDDYDLPIKLRKLAKNYQIRIKDNVDHADLVSLYSKSKIYWHAAGYGQDLEKHPEAAEHFGISTVEAMGAGSVPVVINAGGQKEIVEDKKSGFLWDSLDDLSQKTQVLIGNEKLWSEMSANAKKRAKIFSEQNFCKKVEEFIKT